jgi:anti-sigma B factor antagonist
VENHVSPHGLRCEIEPDRDVVTVRPIGEVDIASVAAVDRPLIELWDAGFTTIALDLRWVSFMDSTGLRLLIRHSERARADGAVLRIDVAPGGPVHRLLELTGTLDLLPARICAQA